MRSHVIRTLAGAAVSLLFACSPAMPVPDRVTDATGERSDAPSDANSDAVVGDGGLDSGNRCTSNADCPSDQVCSAHACVPAGFGFVATYADVTTTDAGPVDAAASEWPVVNGTQRAERRSDVAGVLTRPAAKWRVDTGQSLSAARVAVVDIDGDGVREIVTAEGGGLRARAQDGHDLWRTPFLGASLSIASASDLDGDGKADFTLVASPPRVVVIHGIDGAVLADQSDFATGYVQALVVPDMSGDGRPDIATFAKNLDRPQFFTVRVFSLGTSHLNQLWQYQEPNGYYGGPITLAGDVDGDGMSDLTMHEYNLGWFKSFNHAGTAIMDGTGPRSGDGLYLRDIDGDPATIELINGQDRNGVQGDGHEVAVYRRNVGTSNWDNVWRTYNVDAPPSQPILSTPWADAASDFDGMGHTEFLVGVYDFDTTRGAAHWSMAMLRTSDGMRLGSLPDLLPQAVVRTSPTAAPAIIAMATPNAVAPPLGTASFIRWNGTAFTTVWSLNDAAPAPISTRVDVLGPTGVGSPYQSHGGVADIDGDGVNEILMFARGSVTEFGDRPGELLAVSATDGRTVAAYSLAPEDLVEVIAVEGSGDTLRVWISSHQLGLLALDRHFAVVRRLQGSGYRPTALVLATSSGPKIFVTDSSDVTHVLRADPTSADLVETARLNHRVFVLGTARGPSGGITVLAQDRNNDHNVFEPLNEQSDGTFAPAWTFTLADAESVQVVSRGSFGSTPVPGYFLQIRNDLDLPSSRFVALRESDGTVLWNRVALPSRPYVRNTLLASVVLSCGGSDHVVICTSGCRCDLASGADGTSVSIPGIMGCDALSATAGRTTSGGDTPLVIGGGAYDTDLVTIHGDCSMSTALSFPSAVQSTATLADANGDAVLDAAYWSDTACMHMRDGITGSVLWSHSYVEGAATPCTAATAQRYEPTAAVAADIDGDGHDEVIFGTGDGNLLSVSATGGDVRTVIRTQRLLRDPVLADVDGDRRPEIVMGADDGYLYVFAQSAP